MRPAGLATGAPVLALVAVATAVIGILTGAAPVVAVTALVVTVVVLALLVGPLTLRRVGVVAVELANVAELGAPTSATVSLSGRAASSTWLTLLVESGDEIGCAAVVGNTAVVDAVFPARGEVRELRWSVRATDPFGLMWWRRRGVVVVDAIAVTVPMHRPAAAASWEPAHHRPDSADDHAGHHRHTGPDGDIDDVRAFHSGDAASSIAWAASLRSQRLLTHQRSGAPGGCTVVAVRDPATMDGADFDRHLGTVRAALYDALAAGGSVAARIEGGAIAEFCERGDIDRWIAALATVGSSKRPIPWWRRSIRLTSTDPDPRPSLLARMLAATTVAWSLRALLEGIDAAAVTVLLVIAAIAVAVVMCSGRGEQAVAKPLRLLVGTCFAAALFAVSADLTEVRTPFDVLRGALPQVLVALMVLQNFEAADRRGNRVALAMSAMVMAYATGLRIDAALAATAAVWALLWVLAMHALARSGATAGRVLARGAAVGGAAVAMTVLALQLVEVPDGPARLTLPTIVDGGEAVDNPGLLQGGASGGSSERAPGGNVGGYPGFSPTMDTSTRGPMGDTVVMRVRAAAPDFWRGQTFTTFDGQIWSNEEFPVELRDDRQLELYEGYGQPSLSSGERSDELVQTFYLETDVPNLVFAAPVADLLVIDARAGQRPDGTILTDVTLPAGTVYTVVSHRVPVTDERLRLVGDVSALFDGVPAGAMPELQLPASTTERTRALAAELAAGSPSTYDTVRRIEGWLAENVRYDLDAPVPAAGQDAVDHFLFESQLGFCEQIASATAVLLRSLGVPARVATGYVPSERDDFSGMWISRASDAHAWVEVYFDTVGWQGFDPTADVPLAGTTERPTIGAGLVSAAADGVRSALPAVLLVALSLSALGGLVLAMVWIVRRARRGRWGRLQDRFVVLAVDRGAPDGADNTSLAEAWRDHEAFVAACEVAATLDASVFDPAWHDSDVHYREARANLTALARRA